MSAAAPCPAPEAGLVQPTWRWPARPHGLPRWLGQLARMLPAVVLPVLLPALLLALPLTLLPAAAAAMTVAPDPDHPAATQALVLTLVLNGSQVADAQLVHRDAETGAPRFWLPEQQALAWRMALPGRARQVIEGVPHAAFCEDRDRCAYDADAALLTLALAPQDLQPLHISAQLPGAPAASPVSGLGGYLNYDLAAWHLRQPGASALVEGRLYSPWGHGALRLGGLVAGGQARRVPAQLVWQVDEPAQRRSWQIGSITVPDTALSAGLPLRGLRVGSNARLQPLQTDSLRPRIDGLALRALRADVFVDGLYRQTAQVPYGPYSVEVQPQFAGLGEIDLISTDISGQRTRLSLPYYQAPQMLAPGRSVWSLDLGRLVPEGFGQTGPAPWMLGAAWRQGINGALTAQGQLLLAQNARRVAVAADLVHPALGLSTLSAVWQQSPSLARPQLWLGAGQERMSRDWSASLRLEQAVGACGGQARAASGADRLARACSRLSASAGATLTERWSLSAALDAQRDASGRRASVATLGARWQAGARSQLSLNWSHLNVVGRSVGTLSLSWTQALGSGQSGQIGLQRQHDGRSAVQWSVESVPPPDGAAADRWRVYGTAGARASVGAGWTARASRFDWRADAWADKGGLSGTASMSGALGVAEGRLFSSRRIDDAFVLVDVGLPDLPVLLDNREVARTNAQGWAVVTEARAHQPNNVGVDTAALPIRYAMPLDQQSVVPASAAGVLAQFDISDGGLAVPVRDAQGQRLPAGAAVRVSTQRLPTAVTSRSEVFLERSDRAATVDIQWAGQACRFRYTPDADPAEGYRCRAP